MNDRQTPFDVESLRPRRPPTRAPTPVSSFRHHRVDSRDERTLVTYVAHITFARSLARSPSCSCDFKLPDESCIGVFKREPRLPRTAYRAAPENSRGSLSPRCNYVVALNRFLLIRGRIYAGGSPCLRKWQSLHVDSAVFHGLA